MAGLVSPNWLILPLFSLLVGLVAGFVFGPNIHRKLGAAMTTWFGICLTVTTLAMLVGTIRFPAPRKLAPQSLEDEQVLRTRLLPEISLDRSPSQPPFDQDLEQPGTISLANKTPSPSSYSPPILTSDQSEPERRLAINRLVIPSLHLDASVKLVQYNGFTWDITGLTGDIAMLETPAGWDTTNNLILAGHITLSDASNGPFRYLFMLIPGAQVKTYTEEHVYTYVVREQDVVEETDLFVMSASDKPILTLLTCTDWDVNAHSYRRRRIVLADLVEVSPLIRDNAW